MPFLLIGGAALMAGVAIVLAALLRRRRAGAAGTIAGGLAIVLLLGGLGGLGGVGGVGSAGALDAPSAAAAACEPSASPTPTPTPTAPVIVNLAPEVVVVDAVGNEVGGASTTGVVGFIIKNLSDTEAPNGPLTLELATVAGGLSLTAPGVPGWTLDARGYPVYTGTIPANGSVRADFDFVIAGTAGRNAIFALVAPPAGYPENDATDNLASARFTPDRPAPDLVVSLNDLNQPTSGDPRADHVLQVAVTNAGAGGQRDVGQVVTLAVTGIPDTATITNTTVAPPGWLVSLTGTTFTLSHGQGSLAPGETATISLTFTLTTDRVDGYGTGMFTASVVPVDAEDPTDNNSAATQFRWGVGWPV